ncbi:MAG TPA: Txe/YoeB family addiction module toxin [Candidatus Saccharimonadales bacterium]|jgi:toxin YoeB
MSREVAFTVEGWEDYTYWQTVDKRTLKKINQLIRDCQREPFVGIGKPEPLKEDLAGAWSRRIDGGHRLVYVVTDTQIRVSACRNHYRKP